VNAAIELYARGMPFPEGPEFGPDSLLYVCCRRHGWIARVGSDRKVHRIAETGGKPQAFARSRNDQLLYLADAIRKQILVLDTNGSLRVLIDDPQLIGPNDLTFGPVTGDLYFTDPGNEWGVYKGNAYRYSFANGRLTQLAHSLGFPNGLAVTPDETALLIAETLSDRLLRIDLTRSSERPGEAFQFAPGSSPDGMEWLTDGKLAIAQHGTGHISFLCTETWIEQRVSLPSGSHPTNLIQRGSQLYITEDTAQGVLQLTLLED
jgi:gluconolactonase